MAAKAHEFTDLSIGFVTLIDQFADSVMVVASDNTVVYVNPAFERATGYARDEVIGRSPTMLNAAALPQEVLDEMWAKLFAGEPFRFIFTRRRKDGAEYDEGTIISPICDESGEPRWFLAIGRAIRDSRHTFDTFRLVADNSPAAIYVVQGDEVVFVNDEFQRVTGHQPAQIVGKPWWNVIVEEDRAAARQAFDSVEDRNLVPHEHRILNRNGDVRWMLSTMRPATFSGVGGITGNAVVGTLIDITDRKQTEQQLKQAFSLYFATVESTTDGIVVVDLNGRIVGNNTRFIDMWRFAVRSLLSLEVAQLAPTMIAQLKDPDGFKRAFGDIFAQQSSEEKRVLEMADGRVFELNSKLQMIEGAVAGRVWSFRDVTEQRQAEMKLLRMASFDSLTSLLNRRSFQENMDSALATEGRDGQRSAVLLLDIDHFKDINDSLGHEAGDEVIVQLAAHLTEHLTGGIVGRFGGDEFAVFLTDVTPQMAHDVAERLLATIGRRGFRAAGARLPLTVSIGVACYPANGRSVRELLSRADLAMYEAKAGGRNAVHIYTPKLESKGKIQFRRDWQNRLRTAVEEDGLALYAQPVVDLDTGEVTRQRLTYRLRKGQGSSITPRELRAIAHQMGLNHRIDRWQIGEALQLLQQLQERDQLYAVSLTLDGRDLTDPEMLEFLRRSVQDAAIDPAYLIIVIEGTDALNDLRGEQFVDAIRAIGCRIAIGDLGGSHAVFHQLPGLPLDFMNISPTFVSGVATSSVDQELVRLFVRMARVLRIETVAEGVADETARNVLKSLGVGYGIGPVFGRARPVTALLKAASHSEPRAA